MGTFFPMPGHYCVEKLDDDITGPFATAIGVTEHARMLIEMYKLDPESFTFFEVQNVTKLPEALPRDGE